MQDLITVRLEVAGIKHQILHALSAHTHNMQQAAERAVVEALDNFNFSQELVQTARDELGRATREVIHQAMRDPEIQASFLKALNEALQAYLKKKSNVWL